MYKVLFVIDSLEIGGTEQSLLENAARFHQFVPVICHLYPGETLRPKFTEKGIRVIAAGVQKKYGFITAYKRLSSIIVKERPDLLVAYLTRSELVTRMVGRMKNIPVVGTLVSDLYSPEYNLALSRRAKAGVGLFRLLNRLTARCCSGFIANSSAVASQGIRHLHIAPEKVQVIHRGRDSNRFVYREHDEQANQTIRFLNIGRLVPLKGQKDLIMAFGVFLKHFPDAVLHIAGEGPFRQELVATINLLQLQNKVVLLGARADVPELVHQYDCCVFPSRSEGFSGSVVEAMFSGLPVLASDIPANAEIISHMHTGFLFKAGSLDDILQALLWFARNRQQAAIMAHKAYRHALQHFDLSATAAQMENYLQTIITRHRDYPTPGTKTAVAGR